MYWQHWITSTVVHVYWALNHVYCVHMYWALNHVYCVHMYWQQHWITSTVVHVYWALNHVYCCTRVLNIESCLLLYTCTEHWIMSTVVHVYWALNHVYCCTRVLSIESRLLLYMCGKGKIPLPRMTIIIFLKNKTKKNNSRGKATSDCRLTGTAFITDHSFKFSQVNKWSQTLNTPFIPYASHLTEGTALVVHTDVWTD